MSAAITAMYPAVWSALFESSVASEINLLIIVCALCANFLMFDNVSVVIMRKPLENTALMGRRTGM